MVGEKTMSQESGLILDNYISGVNDAVISVQRIRTMNHELRDVICRNILLNISNDEEEIERILITLKDKIL